MKFSMAMCLLSMLLRVDVLMLLPDASLSSSIRYKENCEAEKTYLRAFITPHVLANYRLGRRSRYLKECLESLRKNREEMLQRERNKMLFTKPSGLYSCFSNTQLMQVFYVSI